MGTSLIICAAGACLEKSETKGASDSLASGSGNAWVLDSVPASTFGIDSGNSDYVLGVVPSAVTTPAHEIAIADGALNTIRFFDSRGTSLRSVGRRGTGPGEFRRLTGVSRCRDGTLLAADLGKKLVSYTDSGGFVAETTSSLSEGRILGCLTSSDLVVQKDLEGRVPDGGGLHRSPSRILRARLDSASERLLGTYAGTEYFFSRRGPYFLDMPLGVKTLATVGRSWLFVSETDQPRIHAVSLFSAERRQIPLTLERLPVRPGMFDRAFAERMAHILVADTRRMVAPIRDELPEPRVLPYIDAMVADDSDRVWVRTYEGDAEEWRRWHVFNPDGTFLGHLTTPSAFEVTEIANGHVLGIIRGMTGAERVVRYGTDRLGK